MPDHTLPFGHSAKPEIETDTETEETTEAPVKETHTKSTKATGESHHVNHIKLLTHQIIKHITPAQEPEAAELLKQHPASHEIFSEWKRQRGETVTD